MWLYACTVFLSAFLLFQIQPMVGKWLLPSFGGSAAVWAACMLFFQTVLLLGYVYSDWSVRRLTGKLQLALHAGLLAASLLLILGARPDGIQSSSGSGNPIFRILALVAMSVGFPYFVLATTTPLVQAWYARAHKTGLPYRLFALSNLASILGLLGYPVLVEPHLPIRRQFQAWSWAYSLFVLFCLWTALRSRRVSAEPAAGDGDGSGPNWERRLVWMAMASCASILMLAVTNHLSQNVAPVPFLWVLPLSAYLLSFVLCFDGGRWANQKCWRWLIGPTLVSLGLVLLKNPPGRLFLTIAIYTVALFICCMFCHSELARLKPHPRHLTAFYLMVSLGGALGGVFVGLVAPLVFNGLFELPAGMVLCAVLALHLLRNPDRPEHLVKLLLVALAGFLIALKIFAAASGTVLMTRNFYGSLWIKDLETADPKSAIRVLVHGSIVHGAQLLAPAARRQATTYYGAESGVGRAIESWPRRAARVGVIGLGAGALAAYGKAGDYYRFYEINPLVIEVANTRFSFLRDSEARVDVVLGDGRLVLEREPDQNFDVLVLDAFSGDSIPVHLLTREVFTTYFRHLKRDGVLAAHVSNQYLDIRSVVLRMASLLGKDAVSIESPSNLERRTLLAQWVLVTNNRAILEAPQVKAVSARVQPRAGTEVWSDDYSNLFRVLR